ncbi:CapA family protein [Paenibacillus sp. J2TS4]|uniref:CapA family protein n=1 Tax=Paenibacillus sp. J2TS4 TaxID=2807194 RepID=UPI001B13F80D|nr:CapA family protein [Paenibacillus sp. J2TS4]GIP31606.1 capsular polysaccharide biosynthesis protein [Paenibacillus sp. J2TS4]
MTKQIQIAAFGDLLVRGPIIESAKLPGQDRYSFDPILEPVAPILRQADLTIGNLEVTLAGREVNYLRRNPRTRYPEFNCPDELAAALANAGIDVLTTANNHCMDRGAAGLARTLRVLNKHRIEHTGTYASKAEAGKPLLLDRNGIRIGILSYTRGTNGLSVPHPWMVNRLRLANLLRDLKKLVRLTDLPIVCIHTGPEYSHTPTKEQQRLVRILFKHGARLVLGSHPHVVQPVWLPSPEQGAVYSMGSLVSTRLKKNPATLAGVIMQFEIVKETNGKIRFSNVSAVPTWIRSPDKTESGTYQVVPIEAAIEQPGVVTEAEERDKMMRMKEQTLSVLNVSSSDLVNIK